MAWSFNELHAIFLFQRINLAALCLPIVTDLVNAALEYFFITKKSLKIKNIFL